MKTKKLLALGLAILMAASAFSVMSISAKDAFEPDESLIMHWDFEGEDAATQLANKAPEGSDVDALVYSGDESTISGGVANLDSANKDKLKFSSGNLNSCQSEFTMFMRLKIDGSSTLSGGRPVFYGHAGSGIITEYVSFWLTQEGALSPEYRFQWNAVGGGAIVNKDEYITVAIVAKAATDAKTGGLYNVYLNGDFSYANTAGDAAATANARIMSLNADLTWSAGQSIADTISGVKVAYDDIRIYNKALSANEVAAIENEFGDVNTPDVTVKDETAEIVNFEGVQFRNVTDSTYDIRFVAKIAADEYTELGFDYDLAKWTGDGADKKTASDVKVVCNTAYQKIAYGDGSYDAGAGYFYITVAIEGIELTDAADYFEATLTAYAKDASNTYMSDTYKMTAVDGADCSFVLVADN